MSSSEDDIEEELRKGFGSHPLNPKKRRRQDIDGKEFGMLGDFADESTSSAHLRYRPVSFAGSDAKPAAPLFKKSGESRDVDHNPRPTTMGSMNGTLNQFMGIGSNPSLSFTKSSDLPDVEMSDVQPGAGSLKSSMGQFMNFGAPTSRDDDFETPRNTWTAHQNVESPTPAPSMGASPFFSKTNKFVNKPGATRAEKSAESSYGIGAKLMKKMGYVSGKGLGADGKGILNPVEHKLRPQGLGLGGVKEKTKQAKNEARRQGRNISDGDDSDDEGLRHKLRANGDGISATVQAREKAQKKAKDIYKTIHDMESEGLHVPSGFKNIINMTQGGQGAAISMEALQQGISTPSSDNEELTDFQHVLDKARQDINEYAKEWRALQSRKSYAEFESDQIKKNLDSTMDEITTLEGILSALSGLQGDSLDSEISALDRVTDILEKVQYQYMKEIKSLQLAELAVAALVEPLGREMATWNPLTEPTRFKENFIRLKLVLEIHPEVQENELDEDFPKKPEFSNYDSLMYHVWLPKVREAFREHWKYTKPASAILFIETWSSLLPKFILDDLLNTIVNTGLKPPIRRWKPASMSSSHSSVPTPPLHSWLFPWLPYIREYIPDICFEVKSRFGHLLRVWRVSDQAPLEGILEWKEIFGETEMEVLLVKNLLPRLSHLLRRELDFAFKAEALSSPSSLSSLPLASTNKQSILEEICKWHVAFKPSTFGALLETTVFTRWETATYKILTTAPDKSGPDLLALSYWYERWHDAFPVEVREIPVVSRELHACLKLIEDAVEIPRHSERSVLLSKTPLMISGPSSLLEDTSAGRESERHPSQHRHNNHHQHQQQHHHHHHNTNNTDNDKKQKHQHAKGFKRSNSSKPITTQSTPAPSPMSLKNPLIATTTFRDLVDEQCAALDLFLVPMRKAHTILGFPLYKITPSVTGKGPGLACYFEDNVLWVSKSGGDGGGGTAAAVAAQVFDPVALEELRNLARF